MVFYVKTPTTCVNNDSDFIFERYAFAPDIGVLQLFYRIEGGAQFEERIVFPATPRALSEADLAALDHALRLVFLLAGVSYYKTTCAESLRCEAFALDPTTAAFVKKVYRLGLGEFAHKNSIDLRQRINFIASDAPPPTPVALKLDHHLCVPIGGGKDSIVTLECLRTAAVPMTLFALGSASGIAAPIMATIAQAGMSSMTVARTIAANLFTANAAGAYNGHVPITAILSAITIVCLILRGIDTTVMSNEHSASSPNLYSNGVAVNHQYSKSFEFEQDFSNYIQQHISPDIKYFSLLRPLSEVEIMRRFARLEQYHSIFRSCNTAFRQDAARRGQNWCCECPKCRFVFLALAPFVTRSHLIEIFGRNLLNEAEQTDGFAALCGLGTHKPFECVGEIDESVLLMRKLAHSPEWSQDLIVQEMNRRLASTPLVTDTQYEQLFTLQIPHRVPPEYLQVLNANK